MAVLGALSLSMLLGVSAFAVDINRGLQQRVVNQRVADLAALAAAIAYTNGENQAILTPTAVDIARVNGLPGAVVDARLLTDTPTAGSKAVRVTITTTVPIMVGRGMGLQGSYTVGASATARLKGADSVPPCILALTSSGDAISTSGGATIDAADCAVTGVGNVANGGSRIAGKNVVSAAGSVTNQYGTIAADLVRYAVDFVNPSWNGNVPAADKRVKAATAVADPLQDNPEIAAARALIGTFNAPAAIGNPVTPAGEDWVFSSANNPNVARYQRGSGNYVVPAGNYRIGALRTEGDVTVTFAAGSTITIANGLSAKGKSLTFGNATISINGGVDATALTLGNGDVSIGSGTVTLAGVNNIGDGRLMTNADLVIAGGSSLRIGNGARAFRSIDIGGSSWIGAGTGNTDVMAGISLAGSATLALGAGDYRFGRNAKGGAIDLSGSAAMIMGDGAFSAGGSVTSAGGSYLIFGKTANHFINGSLDVKGSVLFGAGRYTIAGDFTNGTGGQGWPYTDNSVTMRSYGSTLEGIATDGFNMAGINVTFVLSGTLNLGGGAQTKLFASPNGATAGTIASVLLDTATSAQTTWGGGSNNTFSGAVHIPNSEIRISGGNSTQSAGQCFVLIADRITASGGATAGSTCVGLPGGGGSSGSSKIELIR